MSNNIVNSKNFEAADMPAWMMDIYATTINSMLNYFGDCRTK